MKRSRQLIGTHRGGCAEAAREVVGHRMGARPDRGGFARLYAYLVIAHATGSRPHHGPAGGLRHFSNAFSTLGLDFGTIAAILIGVEAGAGKPPTAPSGS